VTIIAVAGIVATVTETAMTHAVGVVAKTKETMAHAAIEKIEILADAVKTEILVVAAKIETLVVIGVTIVDAAAKI
jgi:uncharacterized protein YaiE (UPF0345 family)